MTLADYGKLQVTLWKETCICLGILEIVFLEQAWKCIKS